MKYHLSLNKHPTFQLDGLEGQVGAPRLLFPRTPQHRGLGSEHRRFQKARNILSRIVNGELTCAAGFIHRPFTLTTESLFCEWRIAFEGLTSHTARTLSLLVNSASSQTRTLEVARLYFLLRGKARSHLGNIIRWIRLGFDFLVTRIPFITSRKSSQCRIEPGPQVTTPPDALVINASFPLNSAQYSSPMVDQVACRGIGNWAPRISRHSPRAIDGRRQQLQLYEPL